MTKPHPLQYFDRIFVINLPSRPDRRKEMDAQLRAIGLSLEAPPVELFAAIRPTEPAGFESIGARGCFMSHLGVLRKSAAAGYLRIAIFEDDLDFAADFNRRLIAVIDSLEAQRWSVFYGGHRLQDEAAYESGVPLVRPEIGISTTHFIALSSAAIASAVSFFETLLSRPAGDPQGGPMHVDGAYSWFRRHNPSLTTHVAVPALGYQRSSRTDVHPLRWVDRIPVVKQVTAAARALKNSRRARRS